MSSVASGRDWGRILADPSLNRLVKRVNKRWPYMSEQDIEWLVLNFESAFKSMNARTAQTKELGESNGR